MRSLTARGRGLVVSGLLLVGVGWGLGQPPVIALAVLLLLLPLGGMIVVRRSRFLLGSTRQVDPDRFPVGSASEVRLLVENGSRLPSGSLLLVDQVPPGLGEPTRLVLDRIPSRAQRIARYPLAGLARGRAHVGPLTVVAVDPFGMARQSRSFEGSTPVLVTPAIVPLSSSRGARMVGGHGESQSRSVATRGDDDLLPREHRPGDDMRHIHWRATARSGELMVRREERAWRATATVVLDDRRRAHHGQGDRSTFEWAVSAAASIAVHYLEHGWRVSAVTTTGRSLVEVGTGVPGEFDLLLEAFADARLHDSPWTGSASASAHGAQVDRGIGSDATALVAVLGDLADDPTIVLPMRGSGFQGCLAHDAGAGRRGDAGDRSALAVATSLQTRGWRVVPWAVTTPIEQAWRSVAPAAGEATARGGLVGMSG